jgi:hypothetical protein
LTRGGGWSFKADATCNRNAVTQHELPSTREAPRQGYIKYTLPSHNRQHNIYRGRLSRLRRNLFNHSETVASHRTDVGMTTGKVKISLLQAMEAHRVARG